MNAAHKKAPGVNGGDVLASNQRANNSAPARRPQPPNARTARARLAPYMATKIAGFGTLFVHAGRDVWDWMYDTRAAVLAPEYQDPALLDWSVCKLATQPVLLINRNASQAHLEATARALLRDGARKVLFVGLGTLPMWEVAA
jgi:hypothetical protein